MAVYRVSRHMNVPAEQAWLAITDIPNAAERISSITRIEMLSDGPVGVGTRWRETRRIMKKDATEEMEITEWIPPRSYVVEAGSCGCHYRTILTVTDEGESGCTVEIAMHTKPVRFMAKILAPIMGLMFAGMCRKAFMKDLADTEASLLSASAQPA